MQHSLLKLAALLCILVPATPLVQAQQNAPVRSCGTTANNVALQQLLQRLYPGYDPGYRPAPPAGAQRVAAQLYVIPVVFHIIHNGEAVGTGTNIADARITEQINRLNQDFAKLNADRTLVPAVFQPMHADMQIQFVLARRKPDGTASNGIDRVNRTANGWSAPPYSDTYIDANVKPVTSWNPDQYFNIWSADMSGGLLGYAQFPDNTAGLSGLTALGGPANTDGVALLYSAVGITTGPYNLGRTATHEVGHWLGLRHIWGDSNCGTDYCTDTPTQQTSNGGCPLFPHKTCGNTTFGDQFMNYMDYTNDACMLMFTADQKTRMQAVMAAGTPRRSILTSSPAPCAPVAATAGANSTALCAGSTLSLNATGPAGATFAWTGPNSFSSSQQNPSISSIAAAGTGRYTVVATTGGCPGTAFVDVSVSGIGTPGLAAGAAGCPGANVTLTATPTTAAPVALLNETFNGTAPGWAIANIAGSPQGAAWVLQPAPYNYTSAFMTLASYSIDGSKFVLSNADATTNTTATTITSPAFSTVGYTTLTLTYQHYYRHLNPDRGRVEISTDGGSIWNSIQTHSSTQGSVATPATETISLNATYTNRPSVMLRWRYNSSNGYLWAFDNVKLTAVPLPIFTWTLVSGDGLPATPGTAATQVVTPTTPSVYAVAATVTGSACASPAATVSVTPNTTTTWTGAANNGNWTSAGNWSGCGVPTRYHTVTIPSGLATTYPTLNATAEVGSLVQNGPLTLSGGSLSLYGNHSGTGAFTHSGGSFIVAGAGAQSLRGLAYRQLTVSGSGLKTLAAAASASVGVTVSSGTLATGPNTLTLTGTAVLAETASSFVLGRVSSTATLTAGSSSTFRSIGVSIAAAAGSPSPGSTTALRITGTRLINPLVATYQGIARYFDITPTINTNLNLTVTMSYNATADLGEVVESRLAAFRALTGAGPFEPMTGTLNTGAGTMTIPNVNHLSVWTLADANAPLPVSLTRFEAAATGPDARLSWSTASEKNNDRFAVEVSTNGREFAVLGYVAGHGTSSLAQHYAYTDAKVARYGAALLYYRLHQQGTDGSFSYSAVRALAIAKGTGTSLSAMLWPNPSTTNAPPRLALSGLSAEPVTLTLRDAVGRVHSVRTIAPSADELALPEALGLPAGLFVLEVQQGRQHLSLKLLRD
jgi:hypothetical protein